MTTVDPLNGRADSEFRGTGRPASGNLRSRSATPESVASSSSSSREAVLTPKENSPEREWNGSPSRAGVASSLPANDPTTTRFESGTSAASSNPRQFLAAPQTTAYKRAYGLPAGRFDGAQLSPHTVKSTRSYPPAGAKPSINRASRLRGPLSHGNTAIAARASATKILGAGVRSRNLANAVARHNEKSTGDRRVSLPPTIPFSYGNRGSPPDPATGPHRQKYPGMLLQPLSTAISLEELAKEIKAIYADLVVVELKCIDVNAQAVETLEHSHYQALIALHRTLLYEHHDFLMATQHPSATPALRGLAAKYNMPARMWKHAIHAFLELLRRRRPASHEFMLSFICLAYQMMCLLYETVPVFTDTWIECLGDLGRYRMVIEEDREIHSIWGGTAGSWYTLAADRHPNIGRLNHHLAILDKPSLRKMFLYVKSLTCKVRFPNARDSLATFCAPFVQNEGKLTDPSSLEGSLVSYYALSLSAPAHPALHKVRTEVLRQLKQTTPTKLRPLGVFLVITNISAVLELGASTNSLWQAFEPPQTGNDQEKSLPATSSFNFLFECFDAIVPRQNDRTQIRDALPAIHAALVWFKNIRKISERLTDASSCEWLRSMTNERAFPWSRLADLLNSVSKIDPISNELVDSALAGSFPTKVMESSWDRPLPEDYHIRGLVWAQNYYPDTWFENRVDEQERAFENPDKEKSRIIRLQWLAMGLSQSTNWIKFDRRNQLFYVLPLSASALPMQAPRLLSTPMEQQHSFNFARPQSKSRNSFSTYPAHLPIMEASNARPKSNPELFNASATKQPHPDLFFAEKQSEHRPITRVQHDNPDSMIYEYQHDGMR